MKPIVFNLNLTVVTLLCAVVVRAHAAPVLNPNNGHYYQLITTSFQTDWFGAKAQAESLLFMGVQGHLATITSQNENNFIQDTFSVVPSIGRAWIGGFQNTSSPSYSEPAEGWEWITGEPFSYLNRNTTEPNNLHGNSPNEDGIEFLFGSNGRWNDLSRTAGIHPDAIVEFDAAVPEPSTCLLLATGMLSLLALSWRHAQIRREHGQATKATS